MNLTHVFIDFLKTWKGYKFNIIPVGLPDSCSEWILCTGFWRDEGIWIDSEVWNDG